MDKKSICAVVVTYNRKELLLQCLQALTVQTHPVNHIVVVDNASSDGTVEFLIQHGWANNSKFTLLTLETNQGGAGGFYFGIKYAYEKNFDYIWLMDDDGIPSPSCLEYLLPHMDNNSYIGPLVLDINNPNQFCFPMRLPHLLNRLETLNDLAVKAVGNKIDDIVIPFNGILLSSKVVSQVGLPCKEYFIWGDDIEYTLRMKKNNIKVASIVSAKFYHPREVSLGTPMFFSKLHFNDTSSVIKLYCMCRNSIVNHISYNGMRYATAFACKAVWFYTFTNPSLRKLSIVCKAMWHGLMKDFTHHKEYL